MRDIVHALGAQLTMVSITAWHDGIFIADLIFSNGREVSSRPSDSVALAQRTGATQGLTPTAHDRRGLQLCR